MRKKQHKPGKSIGEPFPVTSDASPAGHEENDREMEINGESKTETEDQEDDYVYQPMEIVQNDLLLNNGSSNNGNGVIGEGEKAPLKLIVRKSRIVTSESQNSTKGNMTNERVVYTNERKGLHGSQPLPVLPEILDDSASDDTKDSTDLKYNMSPMKFDAPPPIELPPIENQPKPPYKGTMVPCGQLKDYLDSLPTFNRKCMLRKGREVHKIYVDMTKGETFLDDQFAYTEFGKMVLTNGSIRAGRAKNAKQIVVARETLYCSGTSACKRACGGYGVCLAGCDKTKMRGHRCSYRIKLTQRLGFVNYWFVEELGSHDQLNGKDCDFKLNSQIASAIIDTDAMDLSHSLKIKLPSIPKSHRKLAPKPVTKSSMERSLTKNTSDHSVSDQNNTEVPTSYHYVLGSIPNGSPSQDSLARMSPCPSLATIDAIQNASSSQASAIDAYNGLMSASLHANSQVLPSCLQPVTLNPVLQANLVNYMSTMTNLGLGAALQNGINPFLVNVKQEPTDDGQNILAYSPTMPVLPAHIPFPSSPSQHSSRPSSNSHSPSPSRGQGHGSQGHGYRDRSPLCGDQSPNQGIQRGLEIEAKIKREASHKMQAHHDTLGQVHSRIMERAKSRKSSHTMRVPQKSDPQVVDLSKTKSEDEHLENCCENNKIFNANIPDKSDKSSISSHAFQRFQTLNRVIHSEVFQNAKSQFERKKTMENGQDNDNNEDSALNLSVSQHKDRHGASGHSYFRLAEEWKKGRQPENSMDGEVYSRGNKQCSLVNGHIGELSEALLDTDKLTQNEKELMCRVRQLEAHVKQLQNIVMKKNISASAPVTARRKMKAQREIDFNKFNTRHVALKVMYMGFDYTGFTGTEETDNTIEKVLFDVLKKTKLIESKETACYTRCGRTDKGVSAFCQVMSLDLRSNLLSGVGVKVKEGGTAHERPGEKTTEIRYCHVLNKNLPQEIRVLAWAPVDPKFSARFSCKKRTYKYFFPKGELNLEAMNEAITKLVGQHDFRNLCKLNIADGVTNHVRHILNAEVRALDESDSGFTMCELTIIGTAFLWHQIRCIAAVLFLVGRGNEQPEIIDELLNVEKNPGKPQYGIASEIPLCLYDTDFGDQFEWIYEADWHEDNIKNMQQMWAEHSVKATMLKRMLDEMEKAKVETECDIAPWSDLSPPLLYQSKWIFEDKFRTYKALLKRQTDISLEEKIENFERAKRRKLDQENEEEQSEDNQSEDLQAVNKQTMDQQAVGKHAMDKKAVGKQAVDQMAMDQNAVEKHTMNQQAMDQQAVDRQEMDQDSVDQQTVDKQAMDQDLMNQQAVDKQAMGQQAMDQQVTKTIDLSEQLESELNQEVGAKTGD